MTGAVDRPSSCARSLRRRRLRGNTQPCPTCGGRPARAHNPVSPGSNPHHCVAAELSALPHQGSLGSGPPGLLPATLKTHRVGVQGGLERVLEGFQQRRGRRRARVLSGVLRVADRKEQRAAALARLAAGGEAGQRCARSRSEVMRVWRDGERAEAAGGGRAGEGE